MNKLFILAGPDKGRSFDLEGESVYIGRSRDNDIRINDGTVSRKHIKLMQKEEKYFITDLQSVNGTFFDGDYVTPGLELEAKEGVPIVMGMSVIGIGEGSVKHIKPFLESIELDSDTCKKSGIFKIHRDKTNQKKLEMLYKVSNVLMENLSINTTLSKILDYTFELLENIDRGAFILIDDENRKITHLISQSSQSNDDPTKRFCKDVVKKVIINKVPLVVSNLESLEGDDDDLVDTLRVLRIQSVMCVPLISSDQMIGVIYVDSLGRPYGFQEDDLSFFMDLGQRTAVAIEIARFAFDLTKIPEEPPPNP